MIFDWKSGSWSTDAAGGKHALRLTFASDWLPLDVFGPLAAERPLAVYGDLLPELRTGGLRIVNVETTFGTSGSPIPKAGPNFRAAAASIRSLTELPFEVACLANNHSMDYGPESLRTTIGLLRQAGLQTVGAGMTGEKAAQPLLLELLGQRIAIVNGAEGEACCSVDNGPGANRFTVDRIKEQVRTLTAAGYFVVVIFHGGREFAPSPPQYVVQELRETAEAGAGAVITHHPHVPQGIEFHGGVPIVYSQGNFVFWQQEDSFYRRTGYLVHLDIAEQRLVRMELSPYQITPNGLRRMTGAVKTGFLETLHTVSRILQDPVHVRDVWQAFVDSVGIGGMLRRLEQDMKRIETEPAVAAARLRNVFFTPAHRELYLNGLARYAAGELGDSPEWAKLLVDHWNRCSVADGLQGCEQPVAGGGFLERLLKQAGWEPPGE